MSYRSVATLTVIGQANKRVSKELMWAPAQGDDLCIRNDETPCAWRPPPVKQPFPLFYTFLTHDTPDLAARYALRERLVKTPNEALFLGALAEGIQPGSSGRRNQKNLVDVPRQFLTVDMDGLHVRFKYGPCRQCDGVFPSLEEGQVKAATAAADANVASEARAVIVAPLPAQPIAKSLAAPGLCAWIAMSKYGDGLPLYRQEAILARHGLSISRATLASWMIRLGELIVPLINLLEEAQLDYDVLQMDETTIQVLKEDGRAAQSDSRMWVRRGGPPGKPVILFDYDPSRSGRVAWRLTQDFKGYLQSDGFSGYDAVGKREGVMHVGCLAHARRKFDEALKAQRPADRGGLAAEGLALIQRIYRVEKVAREAGLTPEQRKRLREEQARPAWDELRRWLDAKRGHAPPQMLIGKAMTYLDNQWPQLVRVLDDGRLEVDNNRCENALRPFVLGRKAWLFSDTPAGAEASARLYGLVETAKANGCEPYAYLRRVFTDLPKATTLAEIEALLPWNVARPATQSVAA